MSKDNNFILGSDTIVNNEEYINYKNLFKDKNFINCDILYLFIIDYDFNRDNQY